MDINELVKENGWYRGPEKDWEYDLYGFYPKGLGDLIYNTLRKIIEDGDTSEWAQEAFDRCAVLLIQGKRWPDRLDPLRVKGKKRYRSQNRMTRDPWVLFYAACIHLDRREYIYLKPQWWLWRPNLWALRRALLGWKNNYKFWRGVAHIFPIKHEYVEILDQYRDWCYEHR